MADTTKPTGEAKPDLKAAEKASAEVQAVFDKEQEQGYRGVTPDPNPNLAYSPQTGPDSPPVIDDNQTRFAQTHAVTTKEKSHG